MKDIKKVLVVSNDQQGAISVAKALCEWLSSRIDVAYSQVPLEPKEFNADVDFIVVVGGDGTMLMVAHSLNGREVPCLGVNAGHLGFLMDVGQDSVYEALERILAGEGTVTKRMMLECLHDSTGEEVSCGFALNEVAITHGEVLRVIDLTVSVDKEYVTTFKGDGCLVASPTGSTAYSLSASGPILYPEMSALLITPLTSHQLTNRPVVLPQDRTVRLAWKSRENARGVVSLDGRIASCPAQAGSVLVRKARHDFLLLRVQSRGYFEIMHDKLNWD